MRKQKPIAKAATTEDVGEASEAQASAAAKEDELAIDIEAEIAAEVKDMRKPTTDPLFTNVKVEVQCGMFASASTFLSSIDSLHRLSYTRIGYRRRSRFSL